MKNFTFLFIVLISFWSCDEIPPDIPEPVIGGERVVLVEEFSGGSCVPCSDAAIILEEQLAIHKGNLVVVTMHTKTLGQTPPASGATFDFRTDEGQDVLENLGLPLGIPSGVIDRKLFEGEDGLQLRKDKWAGNISQQLGVDPKANLNLVLEVDKNARTINIEATIIPSEALIGEARIIALVTESHIIDKQATPTGVIDDWEHNHIFREAITSLNGEVMGSDWSVGAPIIKNFSFDVPAEDGLWIMDNLEIVAFITETTPDTKEVLQAATAKVE